MENFLLGWRIVAWLIAKESDCDEAGSTSFDLFGLTSTVCDIITLVYEQLDEWWLAGP